MSVLVKGRDGEKKQRLNICLQDKPNAHNHSKDIYLQVKVLKIFKKRDEYLVRVIIVKELISSQTLKFFNLML